MWAAVMSTQSLVAATYSPRNVLPESTQSQTRVKPESQNPEPQSQTQSLVANQSPRNVLPRAPESNQSPKTQSQSHPAESQSQTINQRVKQTLAAILIYLSWSVFNLLSFALLFTFKLKAKPMWIIITLKQLNVIISFITFDCF